jgi:hypothetical protein
MPLGIGRLGCGDRDSLRDLQQSGDSRDEDFLISRFGDYGTYWPSQLDAFWQWLSVEKGMEFAVQKPLGDGFGRLVRGRYKFAGAKVTRGAALRAAED